MSANVTIPRAMLAKILDRLAHHIPEPTRAEHIGIEQRSANKRIATDRALVQEARDLLRSDIQKSADDFCAMSLEQLRFGRDVALQQGNTAKAFALATAIDRKRGLY